MNIRIHPRVIKLSKSHTIESVGFILSCLLHTKDNFKRGGGDYYTMYELIYFGSMLCILFDSTIWCRPPGLSGQIDLKPTNLHGILYIKWGLTSWWTGSFHSMDRNSDLTYSRRWGRGRCFICRKLKIGHMVSIKLTERPIIYILHGSSS